MSRQIRSDRARRDQGITLIEVLITVVLIGILIGPITGGIVVLLRSTAGTSDSVDQSRDLRQVVNYLPDDARSGSILPARYKTSADGDRGSGCSSVGDDNVLVIEPNPDSTTPRIAYSLMHNTDGTATLERFECDTADDSVITRLTVAWNLVDDGVTPAASSQLVLAGTGEESYVDRIELRLAQNSGTEVVSATPLEEPELRAAFPQQECDNDPLDAALGFTQFAQRGDVRLEGGSTNVITAIEGSLYWSGNQQLGVSPNPNGPELANDGIGLYVGTIDWSSDGRLRMPKDSGDLVIVTETDTLIVETNQGFEVYGPAGSGGPTIEVKDPGVARFAADDEIIDFEAQFADLLACANKLAELPDSCDECAAHVTLLDEDGNPLNTMGVHETKANVLNINSVEEFANLDQVNLPNAFTTTNPLIVTIVQEGHLVIYPPWNSQNVKGKILYNFPNATSVQLIGQQIWATILAPTARVEIEQGGVFKGGIADEIVYGDGRFDADRNFDGEIDWNA